jgi:hypothetical protein
MTDTANIMLQVNTTTTKTVCQSVSLTEYLHLLIAPLFLYVRRPPFLCPEIQAV